MKTVETQLASKSVVNRAGNVKSARRLDWGSGTTISAPPPARVQLSRSRQILGRTTRGAVVVLISIITRNLGALLTADRGLSNVSPARRLQRKPALRLIRSGGCWHEN